MKYIPCIIFLAVLVLSSCSSGGPPEPPPPTVVPTVTPRPEPTPEPTPTPPPTLLPPKPTVEPVETVAIPADSGEITVRIVPRNESPIQFHELEGRRWGFYADQEALVGKVYTIELKNKTSSRAKIVVGVDGLNIYRKKTLEGNPTDDIGSILSPGAKRTLPGWQVSSERAEQFVFSPADWSDASGIQDAQIGTILVEVYFEQGSADAKKTKGKRLGTTSGEGVDNQVGTVKFVAGSSYPTTSALLIYGGESQAAESKKLQGSELLMSDSSAGLRIDGVAQGSKADLAGLKVGDIIVRADALQNPSLSDFDALQSRKGAGDKIFLEIRRGGKSFRLQLKN